MTINFPGPYGLRFFYSVLGFVHKQEFSLDIAESADPGDLFSDLHPILRSGESAYTLDSHVDGYVEVWADLNSDADVTLLNAELWSYPFQSLDATFIAAYDINRDGDEPSPVVTASEQIFTFRTIGGGTMRATFEGGPYDPGPPLLYSTASAQQKALVDYILGSDCPFIARDGTFPISFLRLFPGQNEAAFKRVYRP